MSNDDKNAPIIEWRVGGEDELREALPKIMSYRRLKVMRHLGELMGGRHLFSAFLSGKQAHIRADSFFDAMAAMDMEVIIRPVTGQGVRRVQNLKAKTLAFRAQQLKAQADKLTEQAAEATE